MAIAPSCRATRSRSPLSKPINVPPGPAMIPTRTGCARRATTSERATRTSNPAGPMSFPRAPCSRTMMRWATSASCASPARANSARTTAPTNCITEGRGSLIRCCAAMFQRHPTRRPICRLYRNPRPLATARFALRREAVRRVRADPDAASSPCIERATNADPTSAKRSPSGKPFVSFAGSLTIRRI